MPKGEKEFIYNSPIRDALTAVYDTDGWQFQYRINHEESPQMLWNYWFMLTELNSDNLWYRWLLNRVISLILGPYIFWTNWWD